MSQGKCARSKWILDQTCTGLNNFVKDWSRREGCSASSSTPQIDLILWYTGAGPVRSTKKSILLGCERKDRRTEKSTRTKWISEVNRARFWVSCHWHVIGKCLNILESSHESSQSTLHVQGVKPTVRSGPFCRPQAENRKRMKKDDKLHCHQDHLSTRVKKKKGVIGCV